MWHKATDIPDQNKRILVVAPVYPVGHEMRTRIIDAQFLSICSEVQKWAYVEELENAVSISQVSETITSEFDLKSSSAFCSCYEGDINGVYSDAAIDFREEVLVSLRGLTHGL